MDSPELAQRKLIHRGAEADLYLAQVGAWKMIVKQRVPKKYREKDLDDRIRRERTVREASVISEARKAGVRTPTLISINLEECSISISFIPGMLARDGLDRMSSRLRFQMFKDLGMQVGLLHGQGIVHGDLTTSNIIVSGGGDPFLIDFGLSNHSIEEEDRAVDLHLLRRSISTSHTANVAGASRALVGGYSEALGEKEAAVVQRKAAEVARRGRYFAIR